MLYPVCNKGLKLFQDIKAGQYEEMEFLYVAPLQGMRHYKVMKKSLECLNFEPEFCFV